VAQELEKKIPALRRVKGLDGFALSLQVLGEVVIFSGGGQDGS
jgi:hypothetical protein